MSKPVSSEAPETQHSQHRGEISRNQLWETLNAAARTGFFFVTCPYMIRVLGEDAFGNFALGLSVLACMVALDFGLRPFTRVALSELGSTENKGRAIRLAPPLLAYLSVYAVAVLSVLSITVAGYWENFRLGSESGIVITVATVFSGLYVLSSLLVEVIAARGLLSKVKAASFTANFLSIPAVMGLVYLRVSVPAICATYLVCLTLPYVFLATCAKERIPIRDLITAVQACSWKSIRGTLLEGKWFGILSVGWLMKGYALTFLIGSFAGPAEAGTFFIFLKLSELLSVLGANSWDTAPAALAAERAPARRFQMFRFTYEYAQAMSLPGFVLLACFTPWIMAWWFHRPITLQTAGIWVALYGIAGGIRAATVATSMGTGMVRAAAAWGSIEALVTIIGSAVFFPRYGITAVFISGFLGALGFLPLAHLLAGQVFQRSLRDVWLRPAIPFTIGLLGVSLTAAAAFHTASTLIMTVAALFGVGLSLICFRRCFAHPA